METNKKSNSSNQKQIDELMKKIEKELNKPENKIDMKLVDSYFGQIEELDGGICKKTDSELAEGLNQIKEQGDRIKETVAPVTPIRTQPIKKSVPLRKRLAISLAAVFLVIALSFSVAAASLGGFGKAWIYISNSVKELLGMESGKTEVDGITVIKGKYSKKYDTIEDLLSNENFDNILYPSKLPQNIKIKSVTQIQLSDEQYSIVFKFDSDNIKIEITNCYTNDLSLLSDYTIYKTNGMDFYILQKENSIYYSIAQYDGKEYSANCNNYEDLIFILSNMKGYST